MQDAAKAFAEVLGIGAEYNRILRMKSNEHDFGHFLAHFQNNLVLLISKTWVEESDEIRKERLQSRLPFFVSLIEKADYGSALAYFGDILEELAFLLFGNQSLQKDFIEYTLRIDTHMGLFWWYGSQIRRLGHITNKEILRALLLIGICYLTDF
jgi:hypothetical protein